MKLTLGAITPESDDMNINTENGLKPLSASIKRVWVSADCRTRLVDLEPGNGTKYMVLFSNLPKEIGEVLGCGGRGVMATVTNFRNRPSILLPALGLVSLAYLVEKTGLGEGDAVALLPLINNHIQSGCD